MSRFILRGLVLFRMENLFRGPGQVGVEAVHARPSVAPDVVLQESRPLDVGKEQRFLDEGGNLPEDIVALACVLHLVLLHLHQVRNVQEALPQGLQNVFQHQPQSLPLHHGDAGLGGVLVSFHPVQQPVEVEVLVLERVGQLMGHHRELFPDRHPVGDVQGPGLGVVVSGYLFGEQQDQRPSIIQRVRNQAQLHQKAAVELEFLGRVLFSHAGEDVAADLLAASESDVDGACGGKIAECADPGQDRVGGSAQLVRGRAGSCGFLRPGDPWEVGGGAQAADRQNPRQQPAEETAAVRVPRLHRNSSYLNLRE